MNKREKLEKKLDADWAVDVQKKSTDKLKDELVELMGKIKRIEETKAADATLNDLKEKVADLNGGYSDAKKAEVIKLDYVLEVIKERGAL